MLGSRRACSLLLLLPRGSERGGSWNRGFRFGWARAGGGPSLPRGRWSPSELVDGLPRGRSLSVGRTRWGEGEEEEACFGSASRGIPHDHPFLRAKWDGGNRCGQSISRPGSCSLRMAPATVVREVNGATTGKGGSNSKFWRWETIRFEKNRESMASSSIHAHGYSTILDQIKGFFGMKKEPSTTDKGEQDGAPMEQTAGVKESTAEAFTPDVFLQYLKQVVKLGRLTEFGIGLPKDKEKLALLSMNRQIQIFEAMTTTDKENIDNLDLNDKTRIAQRANCSVTEVKLVIEKFDWFKKAFAKIKEREKEGKPLPKSMQEIEALMGGSFSAEASRSLLNDPSQPISRNALCPCGSKKKYKRCCGKLVYQRVA